MKASAGHVKALTAIVDKKVNLVRHAEVHAKSLVDLTAMTKDLFPKGTGPASGVTDAKEGIWKDAEKWNGALEKMNAQVAKLEAAVKTGEVDKLKPELEATTDACAACHKTFRAGK